MSLPKHNQLKTKINDSNPKLIKNIFNKPSLYNLLYIDEFLFNIIIDKPITIVNIPKHNTLLNLNKKIFILKS